MAARVLKLKLPKDEFIVDSIANTNNNNILLFTTAGKVYTTMLDNLTLNTAITTDFIQYG